MSCLRNFPMSRDPSRSAAIPSRPDTFVSRSVSESLEDRLKVVSATKHGPAWEPVWLTKTNHAYEPRNERDMHARRESVTRRTKKQQGRRALPGMVAMMLLLVSSTAVAAKVAAAGPRTPLQNPQALAARVQLKGWGFENPAGLRADMNGDAGAMGLVTARLEEDASASTIVGIRDGKLRVAPASLRSRSS